MTEDAIEKRRETMQRKQDQKQFRKEMRARTIQALRDIRDDPKAGARNRLRAIELLHEMYGE